MKFTRTTYLVMTRREPPNHDSGGWTEHADFEDAKWLHDEVGGTIFRCVQSSNGKHILTAIDSPDGIEIAKGEDT